jgi:hypothetical protein
MKIDSYGKLKINVLFDEEHWIEIEKAIASRSKRLGFATKQKISPTLRDILVAWAREEMKLADHGADSERWLHQPETAQALASAMEWAATHKPRTDNADAILDAASKVE